MAYILGYIFGDGCIRIRKEGSELTIKSKDQVILNSMNDAMCSNYPITKEKNEIYILSISRKAIVRDLTILGITQRKSLTMKFPSVSDDYLFHFIRGYFDADGHVRILGNCIEIVFTSGSRRFLEALRVRLSDHSIQSNLHFQLQGKWFYLNILNKNRATFYINLYKQASIFLGRKYQIFYDFFQNHHEIKIQCIDCDEIVPKTGNNQKRCSNCREERHKKINRRSYRRRKKKIR